MFKVQEMEFGAACQFALRYEEINEKNLLKKLYLT